MTTERDSNSIEKKNKGHNRDKEQAHGKKSETTEPQQSGKSVIGSLFAGLFLGAGLPALVALFSARAMEISRTEAATNTLELILFLGASVLLFTQKGAHNLRLTIEITVWLATANMLAFKYLPTAGALTAAAVATIVSSILAYRRGKV